MKSREKVRAALRHKDAPQIPVDFGGTATSGMHVTCVAALRDYFGLERLPVKVHEPYQMLGWLDDDLKAALGIDVEAVFPWKTMFGFTNEGWKPWRAFDGLEVLVPRDFMTTVDTNGDTLIYPCGDTRVPPSGRMPQGGYFFDTIIRQEAVDEERLNPEDNLEEFGPISEGDLAKLVEFTQAAQSTGRGVIATLPGMAFGDIALVPAPFLKRPKGIRDIAEWYISTAARREYVQAIFEKQCEYALKNLERIFAAVGNAFDAVFLCGTDFGTQTGQFCNERTFRELYMPYYKQINAWIHKHTEWKTFKHSCGAIEPLLGALIESGFDIINPVQCSATGMEPRQLKRAFGGRIVFWGGGVDTQHVLPFGTPEQVRAQVLERCEIFRAHGGFVFNAIHNLQARTPIKNLAAMFAALREANQ